MKGFLKILFITGIAVFFTVDFFVRPETVHFAWETIPAFDAFFGFAGCVIIALVSKALGRLFIQKKEDYYD